MPGPAPKPTALKLLEGNPGHQKVNRREPKPPEGMPTRPEWLLPEAKREWVRVTSDLASLGLLVRVDRARLAGYCQAWARAVKYEQYIEEHGETFVSGNGYRQAVPEVAMLEKAWERVKAFGASFGLSPVDRTKLSTPEPKRDALEAMMNGTE